MRTRARTQTGQARGIASAAQDAALGIERIRAAGNAVILMFGGEVWLRGERELARKWAVGVDQRRARNVLRPVPAGRMWVLAYWWDGVPQLLVSREAFLRATCDAALAWQLERAMRVCAGAVLSEGRTAPTAQCAVWTSGRIRYVRPESEPRPATRQQPARRASAQPTMPAYAEVG